MTYHPKSNFPCINLFVWGVGIHFTKPVGIHTPLLTWQLVVPGGHQNVQGQSADDFTDQLGIFTHPELRQMVPSLPAMTDTPGDPSWQGSPCCRPRPPPLPVSTGGGPPTDRPLTPGGLPTVAGRPAIVAPSMRLTLTYFPGAGVPAGSRHGPAGSHVVVLPSSTAC